MSLLNRLLLLIAISMLPILGMELYDQIELRQEREADVIRNTLRLTKFASNQIDRVIEGTRGVLIALVDLPFVQNRDAAQCADYFASLVKQYPQFVAIIALDASGAPFCSSTALPSDANFSDRQYFKVAMAVNDLTVGEYAPGPVIGVPHLPVALPIRGKEGKPDGIIVIAIDLAWLAENFRDLPLPANSIFAIADRNGTMLVRTPEAGRAGVKLPAELRAILSALGEGTLERTGRDGIRRFVGYSPVTESPFSLFNSVSIPKEPAFAEIDRVTQRDVVFVALTILLALLAIYLGGHYFFRRPISVLVQAASRWREGDYTARTQIAERTSEFTSLAESFDAMANAIERRDADLRQINSSLERRVEDRTRELADANAELRAQIAGREKAEEALRHAQKMEAVGQLTGGIAHDFNNLLTVIIGNLDPLNRRLGERDPALAKLSEAAMRGATRAAQLTQHLLAFSRRHALAPTKLDINRLVTGMSDLMRRTLGPAIQLETVTAAGLWRTHVDANQLENALLNLAINARDAMPDGGRLTIETGNVFLGEAYADTQENAKPGQYVMVAVSDTGTGMTPETLAKAFEPFFTTKGPGRGSGLGLSMVYGFVKQSQGHIKIYSEPGNGVTVKLFLPRLVDDAEHDPLPPPQQIPRNEGAGEVILVVEDDDDVREVSRSILTDLGYDVLQAADAQDALRVLESQVKVDALFSDVGLPGLDGRKLASEALKLRPHIKILLTTGYTRNAIGHHGLLDRDVALLNKPFTAVALARKMRQVLDRGVD